MPLEFRCANTDCRALLKVPDTAAGKSGRCPHCSLVQVVPTVSIEGTGGPEVLDVLPAADVAEAAAPAFVERVPTRASPPRLSHQSAEDFAERPSPARSHTGLVVGLVAGGVFVLLLVVSSVAALYFILQPKPVAKEEWKDFSPPDGWCKVSMPGTPKDTPSNVQGIDIRKYLLARTVPDAAFVVSYFDLSRNAAQPGLLKQMAEGERDHMAQTAKAEVTRESDVQLQVWAGASTRACPGREFQLRGKDGRFTATERLFLVENGRVTRVYLIMAGGNGVSADETTRFIDSLEVTLPGPAAQPASGAAPASRTPKAEPRVVQVPKVEPPAVQSPKDNPPPKAPPRVVQVPKPELPVVQPPKDNSPAGERPAAVDPALLKSDTKVYLTDMQEFDVKRGPWPPGKHGHLGDPSNKSIIVQGQPSPHGLGFHVANLNDYNRLCYRLGKKAVVFKAGGAFNDANEAGPGPVRFEVVGDGKSLWKSDILKSRGQVVPCTVNIEGVNVLELRIWSEGYNFGSHTVWVEPRVYKDRAEADREVSEPPTADKPK